MSFNKYFIPEPKVLAKQVIEFGPKHVTHRRIDAIIGSSKSIEIFDFMYNSLHLGLTEEEVNFELKKKYPKYFAESN
jgi:hypothetical protein